MGVLAASFGNVEERPNSGWDPEQVGKLAYYLRVKRGQVFDALFEVANSLAVAVLFNSPGKHTFEPE